FNGLVLSRLEVARLLTEADIESILFDDTTAQPVTVTSRARFFTGALRRAVEVRDRVCSHPTCDVEAEHCQIDHIIEVTSGGQTTVTNGRLLCPTHNRQRPGRQPHTGATKDRENGGQRSSEHGGDPDADPHQPHVLS
ncbi:MAG: HNH endonuclease signature motif containing protein, partial [Aquihabitans sp.]